MRVTKCTNSLMEFIRGLSQTFWPDLNFSQCCYLSSFGWWHLSKLSPFEWTRRSDWYFKFLKLLWTSDLCRRIGVLLWHLQSWEQPRGCVLKKPVPVWTEMWPFSFNCIALPFRNLPNILWCSVDLMEYIHGAQHVHNWKKNKQHVFAFGSDGSSRGWFVNGNNHS